MLRKRFFTKHVASNCTRAYYPFPTLVKRRFLPENLVQSKEYKKKFSIFIPKVNRKLVSWLTLTLGVSYQQDIVSPQIFMVLALTLLLLHTQH